MVTVQNKKKTTR